MTTQGRLNRGDGVEVAWTLQPGRGPTVVFLPGFRSDMAGIKGTELAALGAATGQAVLRLDYSGHGISSGAFTDGTIGRWTDDAGAVIDAIAPGPLLLVGSSMGGWIALMLTLARPHRVTAVVGIAAAPDFTERLMWQSMAPRERDILTRTGRLEVPSQYGEPLTIMRTLIEEGRNHLLLDAPIAIHCPVRLLQGQQDPDVPWETALTLMAKLESTDVQVTLIKDGDHRLSRPEDLALLGRTVAALLTQNSAQPLAV